MSEHTIWAVSTGEYSDYSVNAIFERREDAEAAIAAGFLGGSYDKPEIQEMTFYAAGEQPVKRPLITYYGWVNVADGTVTRDDDYRRDDNWVHPGEKRRVDVTTDIRPWPRQGTASRMELVVSGPATKRTHKVFTDALAKLRAECIEGMHGGSR